MSSSSSNGYDDQEDSWDQDEFIDCPFCSFKECNLRQFLDHCIQFHEFDFVSIKSKLNLDFYETIRFINYTRCQGNALKCHGSDVDANAEVYTHVNECAMDIIDKASEWRTQDEWLQPFLQNDPLLYAFEECDIQESVESINTNELDKALQRALIAEDSLKQLQSTFKEYKEYVQASFLKESCQATILDVNESNLSVNDAENETEKGEDYYFGSYSEIEIHESMIKDSIRTDAYRDFMYENKSLFKDKVVLDVGCGTGILSMFAAKSGASHVYAVDNSSIIFKARANIKENGLDSVITTIKGKVEEIVLPVKHVDIIISEWMGYFLLFEGMLDSVLIARNKWLNPIGGIMAPGKMTMVVAAYSDEDYMNEHIHFWNDVYGFKMSAMKSMTRTDAHVDIINPNSLLSEPVVIQEIDTAKVTSGELDFISEFELEIQSDGMLHGIVGWFDTYFLGPSVDTRLDKTPLQTQITFSTGPQSTPTHWKQTLFLFQESIKVSKGTIFKTRLECKKSLENPRNLEIHIHINNTWTTFLLR